MSIFVIILLLLVGILLLLLELLVIPGFTVAGIAGFVSMVAGVYMSYTHFGSTVGNITVLSLLVVSVVLVVYTFKSGTWKRLMLNTKIESSVSSESIDIKVGDAGSCVTRLAPMGKVRVGEIEMEGLSVDGYLDVKTQIEVIKIEKTKIIVKRKVN